MRSSVMHVRLTSTCLVLVLLQQYNCYKNPTPNHNDVMPKEVENIQAKKHVITERELEPTDQKPENTDKMSAIHSNHSSTNQPDLNKTDIIEIADGNNETTENGGYMSENTASANNIKKSSQSGKNSRGIEKAAGNKEDVTEIDTFETIKNKEIIDILTAICGEPYKPCIKETSGFKTFKKTSVCKDCSCKAKECQIYKNCCPDVKTDNIDARNDDDESNPVCTSLSHRLSVKTLDLTKWYHKMNNSANPAPGKSVKDLAKFNTNVDKEVQTISKLYTWKTQQSANKLRETAESYKQSNGNFEILSGGSISVLAKKNFPRYLVTDSCPPGYHDTDVVAKCQNKAPPLLLDNIPVSDWFSARIYHNKWCAECHNVSFPEFWRLETDCLQLYPMDYLPLMITDFHELTKNCTVRIVQPTYQRNEAQICQNIPDSDVVGKCNVTGLWKETNTTIDKLCTQMNNTPHYKDRLKEHTPIYKNIFCYICNTFGDLEISEYSTNEEKITADSEYGERRLEIEVKVADPDSVSQTWSTGDNKRTCAQGQIPDVYEDDCIQFECPLYQTAMANICVNRDRDVTGLVIASIIHLQFQKPVYVGETLKTVTQFGRQMMEAIDKQMQISKSGCDISYVKMYANFTKSMEGHIQQMFLVSKLANTNRCSVELIVYIYTKLSTGKIDVTIQPGIQKEHSSLFSTSQNTKLYTQLHFQPINNQAIEISLIQKPVFDEIWLNERFYCPMVLINLSVYAELVQQGSLKPIKAKIPATEYFQQTERVPICYSQYVQSWLLKLYKKKSAEQKEPNSLAGTLSLISTIVSMVSTILVLTTYSIFSELRFIPGKLFMVLCFNLLVAEAFYSFGLQLDVGKKIWCKLIGICIHLFWVSTMFCMNSILWLMLRHIKDPLDPDNMAIMQSKSNYQVFKYSCYCYTMGALCVLLNMILSYCMYHDENYGYGSKKCYINSTTMRLLTFALPIALVLVINFFIFCNIMVSISRRVQNKYSTVLKAKVLVFLKLSTITGFYWAFGLIYEATQIKAFEYLFIVFNGGQGFFLMWSFLVNKRIFELYKNVCRNVCCENKTKLYQKSGQKFCKKVQEKSIIATESSC